MDTASMVSTTVNRNTVLKGTIHISLLTVTAFIHFTKWLARCMWVGILPANGARVWWSRGERL